MANSKHPEPVALLIQLDPDDSVGVLPKTIHAGETVGVGGREIIVSQALGLGHKVALRPIARGEKVLKYGAPIGSATMDIALGDHVHLHNMKSDYLPTHTLVQGRHFAD